MNITLSFNREIRADLIKNKFAMLSGKDIEIAKGLSKETEALKESWANLEPDNYLKNAATFRRRRFCLLYFRPNTEELIPLPPTPYFQSEKTNTYAGGIQRQFAPIVDEVQKNKFLLSLIKFNFRHFPVKSHLSEKPWEVDVHQFRIIGSNSEVGEPTPEGIHHDGDDFNAIHLIQRKNVTGGINSIYDNNKKLLASTTLVEFMDSVYVWDPYVMHGVSVIAPEVPSASAIRDVLVIGYNSKPNMVRPTQKN